MQLTATSSGDADDEGRGPRLPTFLVSPWGRSLRNAGTIETSILWKTCGRQPPRCAPGAEIRAADYRFGCAGRMLNGMIGRTGLR